MSTTYSRSRIQEQFYWSNKIPIRNLLQDDTHLGVATSSGKLHFRIHATAVLYFPLFSRYSTLCDPASCNSTFSRSTCQRLSYCQFDLYWSDVRGYSYTPFTRTLFQDLSTRTWQGACVLQNCRTWVVVDLMYFETYQSCALNAYHTRIWFLSHFSHCTLTEKRVVLNDSCSQTTCRHRRANGHIPLALVHPVILRIGTVSDSHSHHLTIPVNHFRCPVTQGTDPC